jgi:hypothetical protein
MPRPKGPEKVAFKVTVLKSTYEQFERKAGSRPVATYVVGWMDGQAGVKTKNVAKSLDRAEVQPIPKGGKK